MYELKNSKQVELSDRVRFRCTRCGDCCRHVEGVVVVESLDAYNLAKHLGITISDFLQTIPRHITWKIHSILFSR